MRELFTPQFEVFVVMNRFWRVGLAFIWLLTSIWPSSTTAVFASQQTPTANELLASMSVAERVGQLFLVTFEGDMAPSDSDIADLILNYRVGGVMLRPTSNNVTGYGNPGDTPRQVAELINDLQRLALLGESTAVSDTDTLGSEAVPPTAVPSALQTPLPLLIGMAHEGDGPPYTTLFNGLSQLPNNMAIGATWQPKMAQQVGQVVGRELTAVGVNMLFGPTLDVLENPDPASRSDLGTRVFGGDPYWVGQMGSAYTSGVHEGSRNRMAVVATHFPGNGSSDRPVEEEVPTVRKSLEQLKQIELAPFFAVTGQAKSPTATVDALLTTHIRYQGFQGNIRATTAPVSFDPQALSALMSLEEMGSWRANGGIIVSDSLGVRSVERFYDDTEQEFRPRLVAKDALLAGNDLLYLSDFALGDAPYSEQLANIKDTILWFREKYDTDVSFQQRVDEALLHILQLKLRLYGGNFTPENVLVDPAAARPQEATGGLMFELAQTAVTLISPSPAEFSERLASPPSANETLLIFTDVRQTQPCDVCDPQPYISETALQERMLALYGPTASNQLTPGQIHSYSFADLNDFLAATPEELLPTVPISPTLTPEATSEQPEATAVPSTPALIQSQIEQADWIIFAALDLNDPDNALTNFLAQRPDIVSKTRVIVFAYNAPYYLDTTEISKLTAYFGIYSKIDPFIDASVRALFLESPLSGASPVNIDSVNYTLFEQTQPDPEQVIELFIVTDTGSAESPPGEAPLDASIGETLHLQTGIIRDRNGNPVPDGTTVRFEQRDLVQEATTIIEEVATVDGVAQLDYVLPERTRDGRIRITAVSAPALQSQQVDIAIGEAASVSIITPTNAPTATPTTTPTETPSPTATPSSTATAVPPTATATPVVPPPEPGFRVDLSEIQMLIALSFGTVLLGSLGVWLAFQRQLSLADYFGWPLWGIIGGLLAYLYLVFGLPGTAGLLSLGSWGALLVTLVGGVPGLLLYFLTHRLPINQRLGSQQQS
ncbi:MAG: hypothetical protein H6668_11060 [Ardenticatenaceae bacterium]|nr:hypothetical protein [Ardenticatenaceae bacterium]